MKNLFIWFVLLSCLTGCNSAVYPYSWQAAVNACATFGGVKRLRSDYFPSHLNLIVDCASGHRIEFSVPYEGESVSKPPTK